MELSRAKKSANANFDVVLRAVRGVLKLDWCLYEEALKGVVRAGARGGDVTPWFKQMQDLADGKPEMVTSHSGVLFLLEDMGVKLPRLYQQSNMPTPAPAPVPVPMPTMTPPAPLKVSAPDSQSVRPNADLEGPLLFSDPVLPDEVRDFFCITKPSEHPPAQNKQQADPPAYDPFVDDLAVFKRELLSQPETVHVPVREEEHRVNVCEHEKEIYDLANDVSLTREYGGTMLGYLPVAVMLHDQDKRA